MARCHDCDRPLTGDRIYWREVRVGRSAIGNHFRDARLCAACADHRDADRDARWRRGRRTWVIAGVTLAVGWGLLLLALRACGL